ncbi:MAG: 50S ribosomal protein L11 methyltransferase [Fibrobacter sp.]|nr:50S ribosomal protein L11 methyltransferase [Fibrobacter sp.]
MENPETWYKAEGHCPAEEFELASYLLFEAGVASLEELEPLAEGRTDFCFYTEDRLERDRIVEEFPQFHFTVSEEPGTDWVQAFRENAKPVHVSSHLWVRPPWVEFSPEDPDAVVLELEAKTAFGTGEHDSTRCAANLMEYIHWQGKTLLDIGTGTGILSMFARRRGAERAVGTEIDPVTLPCIVENFERNGFAKSDCVLGYLNVFRPGVQFDVIVCNMFLREFLPMRKDVVKLLAPGGRLILAGLLLTEKETVLQWFQEAGLVVEQEYTSREWWSVLGYICNEK